MGMTTKLRLYLRDHNIGSGCNCGAELEVQLRFVLSCPCLAWHPTSAGPLQRQPTSHLGELIRLPFFRLAPGRYRNSPSQAFVAYDPTFSDG